MNKIYVTCFRLPLLSNATKFSSWTLSGRVFCSVDHLSTPIINNKRVSILFNTRINIPKQSVIFRVQSTQTGADLNTKSDHENSKNENGNTDDKKPKKQSKFKQFYSQYGPLFLVVHLTTVVLWIYFFFIISKQYVTLFDN